MYDVTLPSKRRLIVVPAWIYQAVLRNKSNAIDLTDYSKIRAIISKDDMSDWFHANDSTVIDGCVRLSSCELKEAFGKVSPEHKYEIEWSVIPISRTDGTAKSVRNRFTNQNGVEDVPYRFISTSDITFLVINEGFLTFLDDPAIKLKFIKDYLKELYTYLPMEDVSFYPLFRLYIKLFKGDSRKQK